MSWTSYEIYKILSFWMALCLYPIYRIPGVTWAQQAQLGQVDLRGICCSDDGSRLAAVAVADYGDHGDGWIFTSEDSGNTSDLNNFPGLLEGVFGIHTCIAAAFMG